MAGSKRETREWRALLRNLQYLGGGIRSQLSCVESGEALSLVGVRILADEFNEWTVFADTSSDNPDDFIREFWRKHVRRIQGSFLESIEDTLSRGDLVLALMLARRMLTDLEEIEQLFEEPEAPSISPDDVAECFTEP